jgi:adenine-specific DNA-methyltransferase
MIYPRLKVARDLLSDDGVIFISIDDNEVENLRKICDEIFGESNCICQMVWKNKYGAGGGTNAVAYVHEYILIYSKQQIESITCPLSEELISSYNKQLKFRI